jgi:hypothetical protein
LRAVTNSQRMRLSAVMIFSTMPSAKYSCFGSPLMLAKGRTAIDGLSGRSGPGLVGFRAEPTAVTTRLKALTPGDVVMVTRIDRLARSTFDLFAIVKQIVDAKAQFRSLAEPWADTGTSTGRLMLAVQRWPGRRGARSNPHPHRRGPQPGAEARAAHGPETEIDGRAAGRAGVNGW